MSSKEQNDVNQYSNKSILYIAIMRHKKGFLICILLALLSSTFAWFYGSLTAAVATEVDVSSWNVKIGDGEENFTFKFPKIYPGVIYEDEAYSISVENTGENPAYLTLDIQNMYLYGQLLKKYNVSASEFDYKIGIEKTEEFGKITSATYTVEGMPFNLVIDFPKTILQSGESTTIGFKLVWNYRGETTATTIERNGVEVTEPLCRTKIYNQEILDYIDDQKTQYENAFNISIDDNDADTTPEESGQIRITTCDIIDTYFGERASEYDKVKNEDDDDFIINLTITASQIEG